MSMDIAWKKRALEAERRLIEHRVTCASAHAVADKICGWIHDGPSKPAQAVFDDGPERQIAYMIEWLLTKHDKKL